ncbi:bifunctional diguanylate cyclase/phosphodiesterase [Geitlerinema sp. PCC 9228]|uniref:bifunctional diguanylate cyclase/phosphodiesterase n=1 Tax=Geitlerinema sp. PCC 9228 TaxID=111611 RepID=UPI0008F99798|nr:bifunctional diguanylate cyclase/phosphodiesterase [Geitlerinema sp. PCC 9228]
MPHQSSFSSPDSRSNEAKKHERLAKYYRLLALMQEGLWWLNAQGQTVEVTSQMAALLGYRREEILNASLFDFLTPAVSVTVQQYWESSKQGIQGNWTVEFTCKDGSALLTRINVIPLFDRQDDFLGILAVVCLPSSPNLTSENYPFLALQESQNQLNAIVTNTSDSILIVDQNGKICFANPAATKLFDRKLEELLGSELGLPVVREETAEIQLLGTQGKLAIGEMRVAPALWQGRSVYVVSVRDITDRRQTENALRESEERFRQLAENIQDVFWLFSPETEQWLYVSPAYESIWGESRDRLYEDAHSWLERIHPQERELVKSWVDRRWCREPSHLEYRLVDENGQIRWIWHRTFPVKNDRGEVYRVVGIAEDISDRKLAQEQLLHDALHDALTGLPNRNLFMERVEGALKRSQRHRESLFAVLFLDLDRFKIVNDSLGHLVGDKLLIAIARSLEKILRSSDTVARLGGDEFTILLEDIETAQDAVQIAERIRQALSVPYHVEGHEVFTTVSIGIALSSYNYTRPEQLLRDADLAMYRAKELGKSRYTIFDRAMHAPAVKLLKIENDLRRAIWAEEPEYSEFLLYYQPIIRIDTYELTGFEALVRWQHPYRGLLGPAEFIPIAEETGLIVDLGNIVLRQACQQMRLWQQQVFPNNLPLRVSVNLSGKQLRDDSILENLDRILAETGLSGHFLTLELTESMLMDDPEPVTNLLLQLRQRAINLSIDDFGTGYSSLSYLHSFPVNTLKIDKSFVSQIRPDRTHQHLNFPERAEIVRTIITLAHTLGMEVVAEGVETQSQLQQLQQLQCEKAQGYFFAKPLNAKAASDRISACFLSEEGFGNMEVWETQIN